MTSAPISPRRISALIVLVVVLLLATSSAFAMNCVQYAQRAGLVGLHGDAYQWWDHAVGQYKRGNSPWTGAVMVFTKTHTLPHGHVAVVRAIKNSRTVLVDHANWSPVRGRRGQVEQAVAVVDVSPRNDWTKVRVWFGPTADLGNTVYPVSGFIYPKSAHHHAR